MKVDQDAKNYIWTMHSKGFPLPSIAAKMGLKEEEVEVVIQQYMEELKEQKLREAEAAKWEDADAFKLFGELCEQYQTLGNRLMHFAMIMNKVVPKDTLSLYISDRFGIPYSKAEEIAEEITEKHLVIPIRLLKEQEGSEDADQN